MPSFDEVLVPLKAKQAEIARLEAIKAAEAARAEAARLAEEAARAAYRPPVAPVSQYGSLTGSLGYAIPGGNCVNQIPISIRPNGNPITWAATTQTPYIGAIALFTYNHTGIVSGIWSDGSIEIRHQNWSGPSQTRFPRSAFRGYR